MSVKVYKDGKLQQVAGNADTRLTKDDIINILGFTPIDTKLVGAVDGIAALDSNGKLLESQKPIYDWSEIANIPEVMPVAQTSLGCTGNSASASQLETSRVLTIGNTGKSFNGSSDVSWTLDEIGAASVSHTHNYAGSSSVGGAATTALECTGNASTATKATQDANGNVIADTYATKTEIIPNNDTIASYEVGQNGTGWYRIAKFASNSYESKGSTTNSCQLFIKRVYSNNNNEYHEVKLSSVYGKSKLVSGVSIVNEQYITRIRHTVDTTNNVAYIEIYYTSTKTNPVTLIINNGRCIYNKYWQCMEPELTDETVDGVTVYSTMDIPANSKGTASYDSDGNVITETYATKTEISPLTSNLIPHQEWHIPAGETRRILVREPNTHGNLVLFSTHFVIPGYKSIFFASSGNGNNTNSGQNITITTLLTSSVVTVSAVNESGYYNCFDITNNGSYAIYLHANTLYGQQPVMYE